MRNSERLAYKKRAENSKHFLMRSPAAPGKPPAYSISPCPHMRACAQTPNDGQTMKKIHIQNCGARKKKAAIQAAPNALGPAPPLRSLRKNPSGKRAKKSAIRPPNAPHFKAGFKVRPRGRNRARAAAPKRAKLPAGNGANPAANGHLKA